MPHCGVVAGMVEGQPRLIGTWHVACCLSKPLLPVMQLGLESNQPRHQWTIRNIRAPQPAIGADVTAFNEVWEHGSAQVAASHTDGASNLGGRHARFAFPRHPGRNRTTANSVGLVRKSLSARSNSAV